MKKLIAAFFVIFSLLGYGQQSSYNDWFDLNLKGYPTSTKDYIMLSLCDSSIYELNQDLKTIIGIEEYQFDSLGFIVREYYKTGGLSPYGYWYDYSNKKTYNFKDSIISYYYQPKFKDYDEVKRYFDEFGFMIKKISTYPIDTLILWRDSNNKIIKSYEHQIGVDTETIIIKQIEYNSNGDIDNERINWRDFGIMYMDSEGTDNNFNYSYNYIYDSLDNWIVKLTHSGSRVINISQREIKYK